MPKVVHLHRIRADAASERVDLTIEGVSIYDGLLKQWSLFYFCLGVVVVAWGLMNTRDNQLEGEAKSQGTGQNNPPVLGEPKYITNKLQGTNCK